MVPPAFLGLSPPLPQAVTLYQLPGEGQFVLTEALGPASALSHFRGPQGVCSLL